MKKFLVFFLIFAFALSMFTGISLGSGSQLNVWFAPEQGKAIENKIANLIQSANKDVEVAVYDINDSTLVNHLITDCKRGIDVKVIMDDEEAKHEWSTVSPLEKAGILKTDHNKSNFMHDKFMVVDDSVVWTGSTNWTENGFFFNNNNAVLIDSKKLAKDYEAEFREMWSGKFGTDKFPDTPYTDVQVGDTEIQCYFAPEDEVENRIVSEIEKAKHSIDFATFTFTSIPIEKAIIQKINEGVAVRGIYETRQKSQWCTYDALKEAGASVIYDGNPKTMHDKVFIVDDKTVITGSYNPTKHANKENDENVLIIHNEAVAGQYGQEFSKLFSEWGGQSSKIVITLNPGNPYMTVNGIEKEIDPGRGTKPVIIPKWSRTVVPIRAIVEALGGTIGWNGKERKVTISFNGTEIELWIDNPEAKVNSKTTWIDAKNHNVKPIIINSRTMLPLRFVAESLGCEVEWNGSTRTITITYFGNHSKPKQQSALLKIVTVNYNAPGNDNNNLNGEWVKIRNTGSTDANLTGYAIHDEQNHYFYFPKGFVLKAGAEVTIYTGSGTNTQDKLYWGSKRAIWNNGGDTCYLVDPNGKIIDKFSW